MLCDYFREDIYCVSDRNVKHVANMLTSTTVMLVNNNGYICVTKKSSKKVRVSEAYEIKEHFRITTLLKQGEIAVCTYRQHAI